MNGMTKVLNHAEKKLFCSAARLMQTDEVEPDLLKAVIHRIQEIPYYRAYGTQFEDFPTMDASSLQELYDSIPSAFGAVVSHTSGTTGHPRTFLRDIRSIMAEERFLSTYAEWEDGYRIIMRGEKFIRPDDTPDRIYRDVPLAQEMYVSSYHLGDAHMPAVIDLIRKKKRPCLWAYPSTAAYLAAYCLREGVELRFHRVVLSSETLTDVQTELIERAFGCVVKDWYGQAERVAALYRCESGHYHLPDHYSHVEFLPLTSQKEEQENCQAIPPISDSGLFEIVGTTLHNKVMPLVRYRTNDLVELLDGTCSCGRNDTVVVRRILGRASRVIHLEDRIIPECTAGCTLKESRNVRSFQIHILPNGHIRYDIVQNQGFTREDEELVCSLISDVFPKEVFSIRYVNGIARSANGKVQMVVNESEETAELGRLSGCPE